jgi:transcription elongation factor Elf1
MRFIILLPIVWIAFDATKIRRIKRALDNTNYDILTRNLTRSYTKVYNMFTHSVPLSSAEAYMKFLVREKWARKEYTAKNAEPAAQHDWTMFCCPRCSHSSTLLNNIVEPESGVTILFNIIDNCEQRGQQRIVQSCFHQYCNNLIVFCRVMRRAK